MSDAGERKQLGGLARSIDALFAGRDPVSEGERAAVDVEDAPGAEPTGTEAEEAVEAEPMAPRPAAPEPVLDASFPPHEDGSREEHATGAAEGATAAVDPRSEPGAAAPPEPSGAGGAAAMPATGSRSGAPTRDEDEELRVAEVEALLAEVETTPPRDLDAPALSSRLVAALAAERDDGRRARLTTACVRLGGPAAAALADALAGTDDRFARRACVDALVAMGPAARPVVEGMMEDERWFVVRNGVALLGEVGGAHALELLTGALAHREPRVRRDALAALTKLGGDDAGQLALGMLDDPDTGVRQAAATAVGALEVERAVRPLIRMLDQEDDPDLIVVVLRSLGQLGDPGAVHAIERHAVGSFLRRPPPDVRIAAYRALRHIGTPHARRLLNQAVDDRDPAVKAAVRHMLGMA